MQGVGRKALVSLGLLTALLVVAEAGFRVFESHWVDDPARFSELRSYVYAGLPRGLYEPRPHTVFGRPPHQRVNGLETNSLGFFGGEWPLAKKPGVPRIICLGSSTTETGHALHLEALLEKRTGQDFEVLNAGVAGWTTAETLVSYFLLVQDYAPDLIVLHDAINDVGAFSRPNYRSDYTHFRHHWDPPRFPFWHRILVRSSHLYSLLALGTSAPDIAQFTAYQLKPGEGTFDGKNFPSGTDHAYRRNLCTIADHARSRGSEVLLMTMPLMPPTSELIAKRSAHWYTGVAQCNAIARELAAERGWMLADAEQAFAGSSTLAAHFLDIAHLDKLGNTTKAELIIDVLVEQWIPRLAAERLLPAAEALTPEPARSKRVGNDR